MPPDLDVEIGRLHDRIDELKSAISDLAAEVREQNALWSVLRPKIEAHEKLLHHEAGLRINGSEGGGLADVVRQHHIILSDWRRLRRTAVAAAITAVITAGIGVLVSVVGMAMRNS